MQDLFTNEAAVASTTLSIFNTHYFYPSDLFWKQSEIRILNKKMKHVIYGTCNIFNTIFSDRFFAIYKKKQISLGRFLNGTHSLSGAPKSGSGAWEAFHFPHLIKRCYFSVLLAVY
jgi:hypothetical protein